MALQQIGLEAILEDKNFQKGIKAYEDAVSHAESHTKGIASSIGGALGGIGGGLLDLGKTAAKLTFGVAIGGAVALGGALVGSVKAAMEASQTEAQLDAVLKSTGGAAGVTKDAVTGLANALSKVTPFEDDAIVAGESMLLTFTGIGKDVFPMATEAMLNISQAMGQDIKSSAVQLGKALNDPVAGITALTRVGVTFSDEQKKTIKALAETGKTADAQRIILAELNKEFGGSAAAAGATLPGQLTILKNSLGNIGETIGGAVLPGLTTLATTLATTLNRPEVQAAIGGFATGLGKLASGDVKGAIESVSAGLMGIFGPEKALQIYQFLNGLQATMATVFSFISTTVVPILSKAFAFIVSDVIPPLVAGFQSVVGWVTANWPAISATISTVVNTIATVIQTVMGAVSTFWQENGETILSTAARIWSGIQTAVDLAIRYVQAVIQTVMAIIHGDWAGAWEGIKLVMSTIWEAIQGVAGVALGILQTVLSTAWENVKRTATNTWNDIKTAITTPINDAIEMVKDMFNNLAHFHIKLPHFSLGTEIKNILGMDIPVPKIDISWYGKGLDAIFDKPTIIGVGEAGPERVTVQPLGQRVTQNAVSNTYNSSYVYNISANYAHVQNETSLYDTVRLLQAGI